MPESKDRYVVGFTREGKIQGDAGREMFAVTRGRADEIAATHRKYPDWGMPEPTIYKLVAVEVDDDS